MEKKLLRDSFSLVLCLAFLLAGCAHLPQAGAAPSQPTRPKNSSFSRPENEAANYIPKTDPLSTVRAYNTALTLQDLDLAAQFLADDVVFVDQRNSSCIHEVVTGWHSVEALARNSFVLAHVASEYRVEGNRVTYKLTEWLDPRIVGPDYPQPRKSYVIALTEYGLIRSLIMIGESEGIAKDNDRVSSELSPCGNMTLLSRSVQ